MTLLSWYLLGMIPASFRGSLMRGWVGNCIYVGFCTVCCLEVIIGEPISLFSLFFCLQRTLTQLTWLIFMDEWQCLCLIFFWILVLIFFLLEGWHSASLLHYGSIMSLFIIKDKKLPSTEAGF